MSDDLEPQDGAEDSTVAEGDINTDAGPETTADATSDADLSQVEGIGADQVDVLAAADEIPHQTSERRTAFMGVPIDVTVSIGRARPLVSDLIKLRRDSVLTLDSKIEDPVELFIGDRLIARGELQEMDDETGQLGVRLTEVADLSSGV